MDNTKYHIPVLLNEVLNYLKPQENELIVDGTFGAGGWSKGILENSKSNLIALDRDASVKKFADALKKEYKERFTFYNMKYSDIDLITKKVDGIVLDLGVSSMQLDNAERGFSFQQNSKLDMRMGKNDISAYDIVNYKTENELAEIIYNYGDEVKSRQIAKSIAINRKIKPIESTFELANIVRNVYNNKKNKIDPATKTFQAIRIYVNDELNELKKILEKSKNILNQNGRLIIVSFHSLEDAIVKDFIKKETNKGQKIDKYSKNKKKFSFEILTKSVIVPTQEEIKNNIRARSGKLRAIKKC